MYGTMDADSCGDARPERQSTFLTEMLKRICAATAEVDRLGDDLHSQANRIFGHDAPAPTAASIHGEKKSVGDSPLSSELSEAVIRLNGRIARALNGAARLQKIG